MQVEKPTPPIGPHSKMRQVLENFPGARRALFRRYHIGGCSSCGFELDETLEQLCARNQQLDVAEVLNHIQNSHVQDEKIWIAPSELAQQLNLNAQQRPKLVDIRTREEFEATHIDGTQLMTQELMQQMLGGWSREQPFVIIDHQGRQALDAAAYFLGHGFQNVRALRGGIDAWSLQVDPKMPRYRLG
ncbi:MAG: rhodanese-like domain-containing protein [Verrucomicrobiota bacterium]